MIIYSACYYSSLLRLDYILRGLVALDEISFREEVHWSTVVDRGVVRKTVDVERVEASTVDVT